MIEDRLDRAREGFTAEEFERLGKLLYLQTSDQLWGYHMSHAQSLILGAQLVGHNGNGDLAAYAIASFESYEDFQNRIMDAFLPKLAAFPSELAGESQTQGIKLFEEATRILA